MGSESKICGMCKWYEEHHKNAGFCVCPEKIKEKHITGIFISFGHQACNEFDKKQIVARDCLF